MLIGRQAERAAIAAALENARQGRGGSLCLTGDAGIGKTALLDAAAAAAKPGTRRQQVTGVPTECAIGHGALMDIVN